MKSPMPKAKTKSETENIHGVLGSDEAEVKRVAAELAQKLAPEDAGDFGLEVIDGVADNADQAAARIRSTIEALELFVLLTGGDTRQIENELEKIDTFLGKDRAVRVELVRELVPLSRAGVIFELSNALAERDLELALTLARRLLEEGESAIGILLVAI